MQSLRLQRLPQALLAARWSNKHKNGHLPIHETKLAKPRQCAYNELAAVFGVFSQMPHYHFHSEGFYLTSKQKSIVGGMTILSIVGIICKIVGALYRIPLQWLIGDEGMGTYQLIFPSYNMLLTISSAGLPVAISRMVSYSLAQDNPGNARRIFRIALSFLSAVGCVAMIFMIAFSPALARRTGDITTQPGFVAIAPSLLLVCTMSAFRGFMQGQQNMVPTAISQLIEQVGKVFVALPLAWLGMRTSIAYAVAGMFLGTSIAEATALLYMFVVYRKKKADFDLRLQDDTQDLSDNKALAKQLFSLSIPITIGACIVPLASFIDSGLLLNRLILAGFELDNARALYGRYGNVLSLINIPTGLATAIAMSLVPSISTAMARGDGQAMRHQSALGLKLSLVIGLPCSLGMSMLSKQLLSMVYKFNTPDALNVTAQILSLSSFTIVLFTVVQSTTGILQGLRKQRIPMYTLVAGVAVKIFLNYTLIAMPHINIFGAPIASLACYTISMVPNLYFVYKYTKMKFDFINTLAKPLLSTVLMGAVLYLFIKLLPSGRLWTLILVFIGMISYFGFALLTGALSRDDIQPLLRRINRKKLKRTKEGK